MRKQILAIILGLSIILLGYTIMAKEKVYRPEVIEDQPFPMEGEADLATTQGTKKGVYIQKKIKDQSFPIKRISYELLSSALNTRSKRILAEFEFTEHGAIQIGKYVKGVSGDIRITPSGIVARNKAGVTTFALDGETGDAVFKGTVQAGSIISESELIGGSININDRFTVDSDGNVVITQGTININDKFTVDANGNVVITEGNITIKNEDETTIIDAKGLVSTANFVFDDVVDINSRSITSTSFVDVANTTITTPNFSRNTNVLILVDIVAKLYLPDTDEIQWGEIILRIDNTDKTGTHWDQVIRDTRLSTAGVFSFDSRNAHISVSGVETLGSGTHTLKLRAKVGGQTLKILQTSVMYIVLGK